MEYYLPALIIFGFLSALLIGLYNADAPNRARKRIYDSLSSLDDYVRAHPSSKTSSGLICHKCNSRNIDIWWMKKKNDGGPKYHFCRSCGENLWRS